MTELAQLIGEAARGILSRPVEPGQAWRPLVEGGWIGIGVDEADGGQGGTLVEAAAVAEAAGATAVAAPVVEAIFAAIAVAGLRELFSDLISGAARATLAFGIPHGRDLLVPWGREATHAVIRGAAGVACVPLDGLPMTCGESLAGDPLDRIDLRDAQPTALEVGELIETAAALSAARLCGALRAVARLSVEYAKQRSQFGRSIGSFQVIAHALVRQEAQVAQAEAALASALAAGEWMGARRAEAAYLAAALAVDPVVMIAHQVHGAIGVTREHELHRYTLRLTAWRAALGGVAWWSRRLGRSTIVSEQWRDAIAPAAVA